MPKAWALLLLSVSCGFAVEVFSDYLERLPDDTIIAKGKVQAYYEDYYIEADYVKYNPKTKEVYAEGNVYVKSKDGRIEAYGSVAFLNLKEDTGYFINIEGRFEKFYFTAQRVDKDKETYYVEKGDITTCPPDRKEMKLCFSHAKIDDKYVFSYNNSLELFKLPIAYLPISLFPVGERRSGLLPPLLGSNTYNAFIYRQPIYWAISQDKDATLTLDVRDKQAKGVAVEYRHAISQRSNFYLELSLYKEPTPPRKWWEGRDLSTFRENRYRLKADLKLGNLRAGIDTISDPYFLQDVYLSTKERTVPYLSSYVSYTKETDNFLITLNARRFYDTTSPNNKSTLQRLPEIGIYYKERPIFKNLYFNTTLNYTNFYREEGIKAHRVLLFPEFSLPLSLLGRTFYSTLTLENGVYLDSNAKDKEKSFSTFHFSERVPFFFDKSWGSWDFKNLFEVAYLYRPKTFNNPRFDTLDAIDKENQVKFILRNFTAFKGIDLLSWHLEGGYNLLNTSNNLLSIRSILSFKPMPYFSLTSDVTYEPNYSRVLNNATYLNLNYEKSNLSLGLIQSKDVSGNRIVDQITFSGSTNYKNVSLKLSLNHDRITNKDLLRQLNIDYRGACWSFGMLLRDTYDGNRQKYIKEVYLVFNVFDLQNLTLPLRR